jgi:hypothetical protein
MIYNQASYTDAQCLEILALQNARDRRLEKLRSWRRENERQLADAAKDRRQAIERQEARNAVRT